MAHIGSGSSGPCVSTSGVSELDVHSHLIGVALRLGTLLLCFSWSTSCKEGVHKHLSAYVAGATRTTTSHHTSCK